MTRETQAEIEQLARELEAAEREKREQTERLKGNGRDQGLNSSNSFNSSGEQRAVKFPEMAETAYLGLAGDVVRLIAPHTESDPVALLLNVLAAFGSAVGRGPYYQVEGDRHCTNLYVLQVGDSAKARKGTGVGRIRQLFRRVDLVWEKDRQLSGLSSGEGLIHEVRDPITKIKDGHEETIDAGVIDKRLIVFASEFASILSVMTREGNTLSMTIRDLWDRGDTRSPTKHNNTRTTGALVSIVGHITRDELVKHLQETEMASGFANRFLFACVKRSKLLPDGGSLPDAALDQIAEQVSAAISAAKQTERVSFTDDGRERWHEIYETLSADRPGLLGALTARAEAQTIRLALLFALLDHGNLITVEHLNAALAVWNYCQASVRYLFGDKLGNGVADAILRELRQAPDGLSRTAISTGIFSRNVPSGRIETALELLERYGLAYAQPGEATGGRPTVLWRAR